MFGKKTVIGVGALVVVAMVAFNSRGATAEAESGAPEVTMVVQGQLVLRAEAAGVIEPIRVVEVKSKASGEVLQLFVETGDVVARGAELAQIDPRDVQNSLEQAEADLEVAQVQAQTADAQKARTEELRRSNVVTQQEYESAIQSAANAKASLVRAQTNLTLARERRRDVSIASPIAGTVIERTVEVGQIIASATSNVSGGTTLVKMADLSEMQVRALVDETDIGEVRPGNSVEVRVEAYPTRVFHGEVLKIEPQAVVEQNVTMFPVLVRLANSEGLLRPGMNAGISIEISRRDDILTVANEAIVAPQDAEGVAVALGVDPRSMISAPTPAADEQSRPAVVFVQTPAGIESRNVMLGMSDWDRTEVVSGLVLGDEVLLATVARIEAAQAAQMPRGPFGGGGARTGAGAQRGN
jgi:HlyD family secretion protein